MTNDVTRATAEALPEINRRRFLLNTTMAGAAVVVTTPVAAAQPDVHPLTRLHELHDEASKLMAVHNDHMGGEWELRIRAPHDSLPINYASIAAEPEITPLDRIAAAQAELIEVTKIAFPEVTNWRVVLPDDDDPDMPYMFVVSGHCSAKGRKGGAK